MEQQRMMGELLTSAIHDLKSELVLFSEEEKGAESIQKAAMTIMRLYRTADQTTEDGLPFWGTKESSKALLEMTSARAKFCEECKALRERMRVYLNKRESNV
jgi:hypothetical protein